MKVTIKQFIGPVLIALVVGTLSACGDGSDNEPQASGNPIGGSTINPDGVITVQIDATAGGRGAGPADPANKYTYFNLSTGRVVALTDAQANSSGDWHIAFKRTATKLNGGVSGPGSVTGAVADAQGDFYHPDGTPNTSVFLNATADLELNALKAISDVSTLSFVRDRHIAAITGDGGSDSWWSYNPAIHAVEAASDNWWLVKSAVGDSYAKFHITDIVQASRDITLELFIQGAGDSAFSTIATTYTAAIGTAGGSKCYDIDTAAEVGCTTATDSWDLKVEVSSDGRAWNIWSNGGVSGDGDGAAFGPIAAADIADYVSGTVTGSGTNFSAHYSSDSAGGLFADNSWYAYSLQGNHKLWPNYRVYAIDSGAVQYKLQILSFYDEAGTSGMIKIRYQAL